MPEIITLAEIVRRTGIDRSVLNRYLSETANRALFGGKDSHPEYPADSMPLFFRLALEHSQKLVTPKTLAARFQSGQAETSDALTVSEYRGAVSEYSGAKSAQQALAMVQFAEMAPNALVVLERHSGALEAHTAALNGQADKLLTLKEAYAETGVRMKTLRTFRRIEGKLSMRDIQEWIRRERGL